MTPLSPDAPVAGLLELAGLTHEELAGRRGLRKEAVTQACRSGGRIKLSTLAAYARAAGYTLWMGVSNPRQSPSWFEIGSAVTATVEQAEELWAAAGLEMVLAVEPADGSDR